MAPTLSLRDLSACPPQQTAYPLQLDESHCRFTYNGSAALYQAIQDAQLSDGDVVLLPAYCCGAELGPFEIMGCEMLFYDVNSDLSINRAQISEILSQRADIRLLLVTHYLGLPQPEIAALAQLCENHGVVLLEDCAHALFSHIDDKPLGSFGDYAIFSPRKMLPLTEGGVLVASRELTQVGRSPVAHPPRIPQLFRFCYSMQQGLRSRLRSGVAWIGAKVAIAMWALPLFATKLVKTSKLLPENAWLTPDVEGPAAEPVYTWTLSGVSQKILRSSGASEVTQRRRDNHAYWAECLVGNTQIQPLLTALPEGCCPLYFVVEVSDPAHCVAALAKCDIEAFNWWQHLSDSVDWRRFPVAARLKRSLVALPVHQQLTESQIHSMASKLSQIAL